MSFVNLRAKYSLRRSCSGYFVHKSLTSGSLANIKYADEHLLNTCHPLRSALARVSDSWFSLSGGGGAAESRTRSSPAKPNESNSSQLGRSSLDSDPLSSALLYCFYSLPIGLMGCYTEIHNWIQMEAPTFSWQSVPPRPPCRFYLIMTIIPSSCLLGRLWQRWISTAAAAVHQHSLFMSHRGGRPSGQGEETQREPTH